MSKGNLLGGLCESVVHCVSFEHQMDRLKALERGTEGECVPVWLKILVSLEERGNMEHIGRSVPAYFVHI